MSRIMRLDRTILEILSSVFTSLYKIAIKLTYKYKISYKSQDTVLHLKPKRHVEKLQLQGLFTSEIQKYQRDFQ